ncbi:MAG: hypothetical protein IJT94_12735 [Oscillibacter sp.]|nr:hypothetical protein [Oscillibacter sp.]
MITDYDRLLATFAGYAFTYAYGVNFADDLELLRRSQACFDEMLVWLEMLRRMGRTTEVVWYRSRNGCFHVISLNIGGIMAYEPNFTPRAMPPADHKKKERERHDPGYD